MKMVASFLINLVVLEQKSNYTILSFTC
uniref:Uncharacterized protein n=1 Tax=Arundo donax TaxID=35708 RepID=A0A0A9C0U8_ARUDO